MNVLLKALLLVPILVPVWWCWFVITAVPCVSIWLTGQLLGFWRPGNNWDLIGNIPMLPWYFLMRIVKTRYIIKLNVDAPTKYIYIEKSHVTGEYILESLTSTTDISVTEWFMSRRAAEKLIKKICDRYEESKPTDYTIVEMRSGKCL